MLMRAALCAVCGLIAVVSPAKADIVFTGSGTDASDGAPISATVDFSLTGNSFQIVLTSNDPAISQGSVLTNLGITVAPAAATVLPSSAGTITLTAGSSLVSGTTVDTTDTLGQEWAYLSGGAASSGFGVGTGAGNLCGTPGCGVALDGSAFGIVGTGSDLSLNGLKPANTYVENSVTIDITLAAGSNFTLADITAVDFQYGTGSGEGDITVKGCTGGSNCGSTPIPEPASLPLLIGALGLLGAGLWVRARRSGRAVG